MESSGRGIGQTRWLIYRGFTDRSVVLPLAPLTPEGRLAVARDMAPTKTIEAPPTGHDEFLAFGNIYHSGIARRRVALSAV